MKVSLEDIESWGLGWVDLWQKRTLRWPRVKPELSRASRRRKYEKRLLHSKRTCLSFGSMPSAPKYLFEALFPTSQHTFKFIMDKKKKTKFIPQPTFLQWKIRDPDSLKWPPSADEDMEGWEFPGWVGVAPVRRCIVWETSAVSEAWDRDTPVSAAFPVQGKEEKKKQGNGIYLFILPKPQQPTHTK